MIKAHIQDTLININLFTYTSGCFLYLSSLLIKLFKPLFIIQFMKKENKKAGFIFLRYIILVLLAIPNLFLFYFIFTPLTIYPVSSILSLFYNSQLVSNQITINNISIEIVGACVAGSAYYLLLLLNLSIPMRLKKRISSIAFSFLIFLAINILRILVFTVLLINSFKYFDVTHKIFWYVLSGVIVFLVWFLTIKTFKIKEVPFYTDIKFLTSKINKKRK